MARPRTELSDKFHSMCDNVYFQPPTGTKLKFPCIVYSLDDMDTDFANNSIYKHMNEYSVMYVTRDPDDSTILEFLNLPYCKFNRQDVLDNLYHNYYRMFY